MPGDPIQRLLSRMQAQPSGQEALTGYYTKAFGFDVPLWKQYLNFWARSSTATSAAASRASRRPSPS